MTRMQESIYRTDKIYPFPNSTQEFLQICGMTRDGICQLEKKTPRANVTFDKAYMFLDTNFETMDELEQEDFLERYAGLLSSMNVQFKIVVINNAVDLGTIRKDVCLKHDDRYTELKQSFNSYLDKCLEEGLSGLEQTLLLIISCKRKDVTHARDFFRSIEGNLKSSFKKLESELIPMDASLRLIHMSGFYHLGQMPDINADSTSKLLGRKDWKDALCPRVIRNWQDEYGSFDGMTMQLDDRYMRVYYLPKFPPGIGTDFLKKIRELNIAYSVTIDVSPIPPPVYRKCMNEAYMRNGRTIEKQQETRNKAGAFSSDVSYEVRRQKEVIEGMMDVLNDNNESLYYVGLYVVLSAPTKKELENISLTFTQMAEGEAFYFKPAMFKQTDAFLTAAPTGSRYYYQMQPLLTQPLAALTPFIVHELYQPSGLLYGVNQISRNVLVGDRITLINGNGFIIGQSGGGKGMATKFMCAQLVSRKMGDVIVVVPGPEYRALANYLKGAYVDFSAQSDNHINPLAVDTYEYAENKAVFLTDKTNLMLSIFSQIKENDMTAQDRSLIGRVITRIYEGLGTKGFMEPTLVTFYDVLKEQPEERAQELALSMELFVTGAMNIFAQKTNVDVHNPFTVYAMEGMDQSQSGIGIIIMLENIRSRIARNAKEGRMTWLKIDEFHVLSHNDYSAAYLERIWREVRKLGGFCTAITQNVADLVATPAVEAMLRNSAFLLLFNLKEAERALLQSELGISPKLMQYLTNADQGCGLLKFGNKVIPIDCRIPKDSMMYDLFNTNFHEITRKQRKMIKKEALDAEEIFRRAEVSLAQSGEPFE